MLRLKFLEFMIVIFKVTTQNNDNLTLMIGIQIEFWYQVSRNFFEKPTVFSSCSLHYTFLRQRVQFLVVASLLSIPSGLPPHVPHGIVHLTKTVSFRRWPKCCFRQVEANLNGIYEKLACLTGTVNVLLLFAQKFFKQETKLHLIPKFSLPLYFIKPYQYV